ncbi:hypothetical protein [Ferrimonas marina]|nr:hypothetical protein [Ferrimonas marina]
MVSLLHQRGYTQLYLYSGMSPSGLFWRFEIGEMKGGSWPTDKVLVSDTVQDSGPLDWSVDTDSLEQLCQRFIEHYQLDKPKQDATNRSYVQWFSELSDSMGEDELLIFYADYPGPYEERLRSAPGYNPDWDS